MLAHWLDARRRRRPSDRLFGQPRTRHRRSSLVLVFLWFFLGGIAHFAFTEAEMRIVPPYIAWAREAVLVSGVFELLGAFGLLLASTRRLAAMGLFLLTLAVTPCHIYMLQRRELFPSIPIWALWARLPLQVALLVVIARLAQKPAQESRSLAYYRAL